MWRRRDSSFTSSREFLTFFFIVNAPPAPLLSLLAPAVDPPRRGLCWQVQSDPAAPHVVLEDHRVVVEEGARKNACAESNRRGGFNA